MQQRKLLEAEAGVPVSGGKREGTYRLSGAAHSSSCPVKSSDRGLWNSRRMIVLGWDLKALQRVAEPSAMRGEDFLASSGPCEA
ncbi:hypothetical protein GOBAR_AA37793 [Gossypium barbadense]|uniref:Uncharacterized protein n=1 Tax=Gossypium barbadense TaxID=3634 RepID=A0A2P5VVP8_GOSBA|nr:hypothetical protein GOBAR_AA37793 [Gossypium barbadense]